MRKKMMAADWIFCTVLLLMGCNVRGEMKESEDLVALRELVKLDLHINTVRWEVFGTPGYAGGVPGPTDYVTLIAEITPSVAFNATDGPSDINVWIAPEAARPWLSPHFRSLFAKHSNAQLELSNSKNCRTLKAKVKRTGKSVEGFVCSNSNKSVVYLTLADFSE